MPCPSALVVLLSAISLHRVGFGLLLIVAFSAGLASVLVAIGLLMVTCGRVMERLPWNGALVRRLPVVSAAVVCVLGAAVALQSLSSGGAAPRIVIDHLSAAKERCDLHASLMAQAAIYDFTRRGLLAKHIKRAKKAYAHRRDAMLQAQLLLVGGAEHRPQCAELVHQLLVGALGSDHTP